jgi:hypothetical protein
LTLNHTAIDTESTATESTAIDTATESTAIDTAVFYCKFSNCTLKKKKLKLSILYNLKKKLFIISIYHFFFNSLYLIFCEPRYLYLLLYLYLSFTHCLPLCLFTLYVLFIFFCEPRCYNFLRIPVPLYICIYHLSIVYLCVYLLSMYCLLFPANPGVIILLFSANPGVFNIYKYIKYIKTAILTPSAQPCAMPCP